MALKLVKEIVRSFLNVQDRDILFGTRADATLAAVKQYRLSLLNELRGADSVDNKQLTTTLQEAGLPSHISARDSLLRCGSLPNWMESERSEHYNGSDSDEPRNARKSPNACVGNGESRAATA